MFGTNSRILPHCVPNMLVCRYRNVLCKKLYTKHMHMRPDVDAQCHVKCNGLHETCSDGHCCQASASGLDDTVIVANMHSSITRNCI